MKVVILCGGFGTRIRDVADDIPKPMIPIGGYPIIWHIMKYYASFGHKEFILCLGYKSSEIKNFFINYKTNVADLTVQLGDDSSEEYHNGHDEEDWKITLAETGLNTMTGGRISRIKKYLNGDKEFLLTYGDGVGDIDINDTIRFHRDHGKTVTVTGVHPPGRFGVIEHSEDGTVKEFNEKPQSSEGVISGGFFVCNDELFEYLSDDESLVFEQGPMKNLVKDQQLSLYKHNGFWQPMDTAREYSLLNKLFIEKKAPWVVW